MIYDSLTLAACIAEMNRTISGLIVHQVRQPDELTVILVCRKGPRYGDVLLSADPRYARAHLTSMRQPQPKTPFGFCQLLRKWLEGRRVEGVEQAGIDRVLRIGFHNSGGAPDAGQAGDIALVHEIMGKHSNIVLVSADNRVLGAAKVVTQRISRVRQVMPNQPYVLPPQSKRDPRSTALQEFEKIWAESIGPDASREDISRWMVRTFAGVSPILADETCAHAENTSCQAHWQALRALLNTLSTQDFHPVILRRPSKPFEEVYPLPLAQYPAEFQFPRDTISEALEATVRTEIARADVEGLRQETLRLIERSRSALQQERDELAAVVSDPTASERLRQRGELLTASFHQIPAGESSVELTDYYDPEMKAISIELRPGLSPRENVDRYFRLARKADGRLQAATTRLPQVEQDLQRLDGAEEEIRREESVEAIRERRKALENARLLRTRQEHLAEAPEDRPFGGMRIRSLTSRDGVEILYGESSEANDYLTAKLARPDDIWLHARAVTGAHVVIRTAGLKSVPPATLQQAAALARDHSDAKHSSYVAVDWTLRKHVRKPRKSAPGFVVYTHEKTIHVTH